MKYKFEPFKDYSELHQWAADRKPIKIAGSIFTANEDGQYFCLNKCSLHFSDPLGSYQKAIPVKTKKIEFNVSFYIDDYDQVFINSMGDVIGNKWKFIKTEKFSTEIEVSE
jgi:hypothetical protein